MIEALNALLKIGKSSMKKQKYEPKGLVKTNNTLNKYTNMNINVIMNNIIGCNIPADAIFPVDTISVMSKGISEFENATRLSIESFTIDIMSEKFFIITVTINMYVT